MLVVGKALRRLGLAIDARLVIERAREVALLHVLDRYRGDRDINRRSAHGSFATTIDGLAPGRAK